MVEVASKRLSFDYRTGKNSETDQGTIHCELLVFERGSWVSLPVYSIASETVNGRQIITGYVESRTDQKFRASLSYCHPNSKRTSKWHIDHNLLCAIHVDGRKKPVCEYTIRQNANENPVDLTGCATAYGLPFANVPSEQNQSFSWQKRNLDHEQIPCRPPGITSIDEHSSISFKLSRCEIHRIVRDRTGKAAFPSTQPSLTPSKRDKDFEPIQGSHRRLSHYIQIAKGAESTPLEDELVPEFEVTSGPFVEFMFYYKSRSLLESLELASGMKERPRRGVGLASSKSLSDLPSKMLDAPASSIGTSVNTAPNTSASSKRKPSHQEFQHPTSRTITSRPSSASSSSRSTGLRPARPPSPELPQISTSAKAFKRPRLDDRHGTPYYPRNAASTSPPRKRLSAASTLPSFMRGSNGSNDQESTASLSLSASHAPASLRDAMKKRKSPQQIHTSNNDQGDAASLPSPPASPVPSAISDTSLPNLADIFPPRNQSITTKQHSPVRPLGHRTGRHSIIRPINSDNINDGGHASSSGRMSPSRQDGSPSRNATTAQTITGQSVTPKRKARPPLIPNFNKSTPTRKEPSAAEMDAVRAAVLTRSPEASRAQLAPAASPSKSATQPVSGQGSPSASRAWIIATSSKAAAPTAPKATEVKLPSSSPAQKPDIASITAAASLSLPQAGPSTPRSTAPERTATPTAKQEQTTPNMKRALPSSSTVKVKEEVIDLTMDSENEGEGDDKKDVKSGFAKASGGSAATTAATAPSADMKAEIVDRKNASEHATDLLNELDIFDVGNIQALINVGYKSTRTFVTRLPLLDVADRRNIMEELTKEMGKLDFGILRAYLKRQGVELEN